MNRTKSGIAIVCALLLAVAVGNAGEKAAWFDLEGCDVCRGMSSQEGLMEHMQWENHVIKNGVLSVTVVDPAYQAAYERAEKHMGEMGAKLAAGEELQLCGFCSSMGNLMMKGAQRETVKTAAGLITLVTSNDPQVAEAIRKHGQHTIDEYAKMMAAGQPSEHKGH